MQLELVGYIIGLVISGTVFITVMVYTIRRLARPDTDKHNKNFPNLMSV